MLQSDASAPTPGKFPGNEVAFSPVSSGSSVTVYGTTFGLFNYYLVMLTYLICGGMDAGPISTMNGWYQSFTQGDSMVGIGPGPNTKMFYGWNTVKDMLEEWAPKQKDGTLKRYNELGVQIQNNVMWPETGTIALGYGLAQGGVVRPTVYGAFDGSQRPEGTPCDGSTCWTKAWLKSVFRARFQSMDSFSAGDLKWFITLPLHKIAVNANLTDEEAQEFGAYMMAFIIPAPAPQSIADSGIFKTLLGIGGKLKKKAGYIERMKAGLKQKYPEQMKNDDTLTLASSSFLDALLLAGGLSVPTILEFMLALYYTWWFQRPTALNGANLGDNTTLYNFMFETMRRYPAVAGVPRWVRREVNGPWTHEIPLVSQALNDPTVFPDPRKFIMGRPGFNAQEQTRSIGWADFAVDEGSPAKPAAHACPGKELSMAMTTAFMEEFVAAGPWAPAFPWIVINLYKTSGFTLCKTSAFGACFRRRLMWALGILALLCCLCCCCALCGYGCHRAGVCKKKNKTSPYGPEYDLSQDPTEYSYDYEQTYEQDPVISGQVMPLPAGSAYPGYGVSAVQPFYMDSTPLLTSSSYEFTPGLMSTAPVTTISAPVTTAMPLVYA